jgi:hypothetical protein
MPWFAPKNLLRLRTSDLAMPWPPFYPAQAAGEKPPSPGNPSRARTDPPGATKNPVFRQNAHDSDGSPGGSLGHRCPNDPPCSPRLNSGTRRWASTLPPVEGTRGLSRIHAVMISHGAAESAERRAVHEPFDAGNRSPSGDRSAFSSNVPSPRSPREPCPNFSRRVTA